MLQLRAASGRGRAPLSRLHVCGHNRERMIVCDSCGIWVHTRCDGVWDQEEEPPSGGRGWCRGGGWEAGEGWDTSVEGSWDVCVYVCFQVGQVCCASPSQWLTWYVSRVA